MSRRTALMAFAAATPAKRRLALEAAAELLRARALTLLPARIYTAGLGALGQGAAPASLAEAEGASRVGAMVAAVAGRLPLRLRCLEQAIALRRMLDRRRVPASVCLGVSLARADRQAPALGRAAHAWVEVGGRVVAGDGELDRYAEVARFR